MARRNELVVLLVAALVFLGTLISPPRLMDDVDAVQAQIARNMLESGDWVTARLNGVAYLEKSPLVYWLMALSFAVFGVNDWAARLPIALSAVALCWTVYRIGRWGLGERPAFLAGLVISTSIGLWLFTRILIPDVILTLCVALALWAVLRATDDRESRPRMWAHVFWVAIGVGLLLKGLIAAVFPVAAAAIYFAVRRELPWRRLHPVTGVALTLLIAAPWHIAAMIANPPLFDLTPRSEPGQYHGFFWFYFLNEHVFRFLNMRHPRDYNTVPRLLFWGLHLVWFFPWSAWLLKTARLQYKGEDRGARLRLLMLCLAGFVLVFFTFSTTQEYYSMPAYPAFALLLGAAIADTRSRWPGRVVTAVAGVALAAIVFVLVSVWGLPAPGDISQALTQNPDAYTLSLGHMGDLTIASFAYLKLPLAFAAVALVIGLAGRRPLALAAMMVLFLHAARIALIAFDPYLGSFPLAHALRNAPPGRLIADNQYYTFSSVFFYAHQRAKRALLLNGRKMNLEYGSYAPGAPDVFTTDAELPRLWQAPERVYLLIEGPERPRIERLLGPDRLHNVAASGGKVLLTNARLH